MNARKALVAALLAVALVIAWNLAVFAPKGRAVREAQQRADQAAIDNETLEAQRTVLQQLAKDSAQTRAELNELQAKIPTQDDLDAFIVEANAIAEQAGMDWRSISPTPPASTGAPVSEVRITIQLRGAFRQILDYLRRMETMDRLIVIDSIELTADAAASTSGGPTLAASMQTRMFVQPGTGTTPSGAPTPTVPGDTTSTVETPTGDTLDTKDTSSDPTETTGGNA